MTVLPTKCVDDWRGDVYRYDAILMPVGLYVSRVWGTTELIIGICNIFKAFVFVNGLYL